MNEILHSATYAFVVLLALAETTVLMRIARRIRRFRESFDVETESQFFALGSINTTLPSFHGYIPSARLTISENDLLGIRFVLVFFSPADFGKFGTSLLINALRAILYKSQGRVYVVLDSGGITPASDFEARANESIPESNGSLTFLVDPTKTLRSHFHITSTPASLEFDHEARVVRVGKGRLGEAAISQASR